MLELETLLSPIGVKTFFEDYHSKKPLLIHREDESFYGNLFSLEEFEFLAASYANPKLSQVRLEKAGVPKAPIPLLRSGFTDMPALYESYYRGYTIVMESAERKFPDLSILAQNFSEMYEEYQVPLLEEVMFVSFLSPANSQALAPHYDPMDVFIVQLDGCKHWKLYGYPGSVDSDDVLQTVSSPYDLACDFPSIDDGVLTKKVNSNSLPTYEFTLEKGDMLYIPQGYVHCAHTAEKHSFHLSLLMRKAASWREILNKISSEVFSLRKSAEPGMFENGSLTPLGKAAFTKEIESLLSGPKWERLLDQIKLTGPARPSKVKNLQRMNRAMSIDGDTMLFKPDGLIVEVRISEEEVFLDFGLATIKAPLAAAEAFQFAAEHDGPFSPECLPGSLTLASKVMLAKKMFREGFLDIFATETVSALP